MTTRSKVVLTVLIFAGTLVRASSQNAPAIAASSCVIKVSELQVSCPTEWQIVDENEGATTIGNFDRPDRTTNLVTPSGKATIVFHSKPALYRNLKEWVFAATKMAPDAVQSSKKLTNKLVGPISTICFASPESEHGWIYESYFFEMNDRPIDLELNYQRTSPNAAEFRGTLDKLVESLETTRP